MGASTLKGNRLLDGLLISGLLHLLVLLYAESALHAWTSHGTSAVTHVANTPATAVSCCVAVRLELAHPSSAAPLPAPLQEPIETAAPIQHTSASAPTKAETQTAPLADAHASLTRLLQGPQLAEAVYFFDKSELNVFPVLETPLEFDIASLPIDDVALGYADIVIYIQSDGQVVKLETEFNSLSEPTLRLVAQTLLKAAFTPGRVSGDPVPAKIRWRIVVESASSFTMMNSSQ